MNRAEATRLARICLPGILRRESGGGFDGDGSSSVAGSSSRSSPSSTSTSTMISESDVEFKSLCRLWAGMGHIYEVSIDVPERRKLIRNRRLRFIVKRVTPPPRKRRDAGDERKAASYVIESNFYEHMATALIENRGLRMPFPYHVERSDDDDDRVTICMSFLDGSPAPRHSVVDDDGRVRAVLSWLATLHAATWSSVVDHDLLIERKIIQPIGSYWHLDTRPDEHASMSSKGWEGRLKLAARAIHDRLGRDGMQCVVHGDAKDANMLFLDDDDDGGGGGGGACRVGMYDFQYCGKAPPSVGHIPSRRSSFLPFCGWSIMTSFSHSLLFPRSLLFHGTDIQTQKYAIDRARLDGDNKKGRPGLLLLRGGRQDVRRLPRIHGVLPRPATARTGDEGRCVAGRRRSRLSRQ